MAAAGEARGAAAPARSPVGDLDQVLRIAAVGSLSSSLIHQVASYIQGLVGYLDELHYICESELEASDEVSELIAGAQDRAVQMMRLFRAMRGLIRSGEVARRPALIADLVEQALLLCGSYVHSRARLELSELPTERVVVSEALFIQVVTSALRKAADHAGPGAVVTLSVAVIDDVLRILVHCQQAGDDLPVSAADEELSRLWSATAARVMEEHGGAIRCLGDGAYTEIELPVHRHTGLGSSATQ